MAPKDMGALYAENMAHFSCGHAMFQPVSASDMRPPCVGYLDSKRRWNHIADIEWPRFTTAGTDDHEGHVATASESMRSRKFKGLEEKPLQTEQVEIEWRPRASIGVRQWTVDASGSTPNTIPIGADAHIKYKSNTKFGAVLIAQNPVTLTTYNDETLFRRWLSQNSAMLSTLHGNELRRYGLWLVTRTYTASRVSINAWEDKDKEANMSVKAKASMMGELGSDLEWTDKLTDKDWSHYGGLRKGEGVVMFFDGIDVPNYQWWWAGLKGGMNGKHSRRNSAHLGEKEGNALQVSEGFNVPGGRQRYIPSAEYAWEKETSPAQADLWGSETPLRDRSPLLSARDISRGRPRSPKSARSVGTVSSRNSATPKRDSKNLDDNNKRRSLVNGDRNHLAPVADATPPEARFSTASTAANSGPRDQDVGATKKLPETPAATNGTRRALRRKGSSPTLRLSS